MEEVKRKFPLSIYEVILLVIIIPIVFYYSGKLLWMVLESETPPRITYWLISLFTGIWGFLAVLGFDCIWIIAMIYGPLKNLRIKIYTTVFILTISAVILVSILAAKALAGSMH